MGIGIKWFWKGKSKDRDLDLVPCQNIYLSDDSIDIEAALHDIRMGRRRPWHIIAISDNDGELFRIYPAKEFRHPVYNGRRVLVCGIAKGARGAKDLLLNMISDIYHDTRGFNVKAYFHL